MERERLRSREVPERLYVVRQRTIACGRIWTGHREKFCEKYRARDVRWCYSKFDVKDERIGVRVPREIKVALQNIAKKEGRSLAQVCELLLKGGILEYERTGPDYLRRLLIMRTGVRSK